MTRETASRTKSNGRQKRGSALVEFAAAIAVLIPLVFLTIFACYEVTLAFMIYNALNQAAHSAAMVISREYGSDPTVATDTSKQTALLSHITFSNMVVSPNQFTVSFPPSPDTTSWTDLTTAGRMILVTCTYTGGKNGLAPFPYPDPLNLGQSFTLQASAVAYLE